MYSHNRTSGGKMQAKKKITSNIFSQQNHWGEDANNIEQVGLT